MVTIAVTSPCSDTILPEIASIGQRDAGLRVDEADARRCGGGPSASKNRLETKDEKWASLACTTRWASSPPRFGHGEEALGRRVHHHDVAAGIGHEDGIGHRVDDEVQPVALGADLGLRLAQPPVVLLDLVGGPLQVGDVAQDRDDAGALARVAGRPCSAPRTGGRSRRPDRPAAPRGAAPPRLPARGVTARPRTACCSARPRGAVPRSRPRRVASRASARALAIMMRPSASVSRIGSVTVLMML